MLIVKQKNALIFIFLLLTQMVGAQNCAVNDFCANALPLTGTGCNEGATGEPDEWTPDYDILSEAECDAINYQTPCFIADGSCIAWNANQNGVWYEFSVNATTPNPLSITIFDISCSDGFELLQLGIWTNSGSCDLGQETLMECATVSGDYTFSNLNLAIGDYYLFIDGSGGADCTWRFDSEELLPCIAYIDTIVCGNSFVTIDGNDYNVGQSAEISLSSATCPDSILYLNVQASYFPAINLPEITPIFNDKAQLNTQITDETGIRTIIWSPSTNLTCTNCLNPFVIGTPTADTTEYELIIIMDNGCSDRFTTKLVKTPITTPIIPTAFSPNFDGVNDLWQVTYEGNYDFFEAVIFDRWGKKIHTFNSPQESWTGIDELGSNPPIGVYLYYVRIENTENAPFEAKGTITLIK